MWFKVLRSSNLRETADRTSPAVGEAFPNDVGNRNAVEGERSRIFIRRDAGGFDEGWLDQDRLEETPPPPRPELRVPEFLRTCVDAETWINDLPGTAPHFVLADYLIALAKIETLVRNSGPMRPDFDTVGPFQLSVEDWALFLAGPGKEAFSAQDRDDYLDQCYAIAWLTHLNVRKMSEELNPLLQAAAGAAIAAPPAGGSQYIPSLVDLLIARLTSVECAIEFRKTKLRQEGNRRVTDVLMTTMPAPIGGDARAVDALMRHRHDFLKQSAESGETTDGMYAKVENRLDRELEFAFKLMKEHIPEDVPTPTGDAPWIPKARDEDALWDRPDMSVTSRAGIARIIKYFTSTNNPQTAVAPWCGAFASHCMSEAGLASTIVKDSAIAANWKKWGNTAISLGATIPEGAVVVLAPAEGSDSSGHVGFYMRHLSGRSLIELLGGNQSETVRLSKFSATKIVAIRWNGVVEDGVSIDTGPGATPGRFKDLLDFIAEFESGGNYDAHFGRAKNTNPAFTRMSIADVLRWQDEFVRRGSESSAVGRYQVIRKTLRGVIRELGVGSNELYSKELQDRIALHLMKGRKLDGFLAGRITRNRFGTLLAMEWASLPVLEGPKTGQSFYAGVGSNAAHAPMADFRRILDAL
jgi:uncharacterized protein (TIGR02594 family)